MYCLKAYMPSTCQKTEIKRGTYYNPDAIKNTLVGFYPLDTNLDVSVNRES